MADENELGAANRRPPATIDVQATEIASEPVKSPEGVESIRQTSDLPGATGSDSAGDTPEPRLTDKPSASGAPPSPVRSIVLASVIGAAAMAAIFGALWWFVLDDRADMSARVMALEAKARTPAANPGALAALDSRIAKIEAAGPAPADKTLADRVAATETAAREARTRADAALDAAQKNAASQPSVAPAVLDALTARVTALEQATKATSDKVAHVAAVSAGQDRAGRLAFVAIALRDAVVRGEPYEQELAAAKQLVPEVAALAPLAPFAATGVPQPSALAQELSQLTALMTSAAASSPREGGILDRLQQNAEKLVRIRPINAAPGDDAAAVVARAQTKATQGNLAGAVADLTSLPEGVRAPAQGWITKAEARTAALAAARALADNAVGALGKAAP